MSTTYNENVRTAHGWAHRANNALDGDSWRGDRHADALAYSAVSIAHSLAAIAGELADSVVYVKDADRV